MSTENQKYCACGCGQTVKAKNKKYINGHKERLMTALPRPCACGCGQIVTNPNPNVKYLPGHHLKCKEIINNRKMTYLKHYGVDNPSKAKEIKDKKIETCLKHFGVQYSVQDSNIKEKIKRTCIEKYGVENPRQLKEFKEKSKQTCLEKYGVEHVTQVESIKEKMKQTFLNKYGVENASQVKEIQERKTKTFLERFGETTNLKCKETKEKIKQTCIRKYGVDHPMKNENQKYKTLNALRLKAWDNIQKQTLWIPLFTKEEFLKHGWQSYTNNETIYYPFKCSICGNIEQLSGKYLPLCSVCNPNIGKSKVEEELYEFIKQCLPSTEIITSDRTIIAPRELDIYIPSLKLAIEFDGLFWHSYDQIKDINYHLSKTEECNQKGIQLIHIFEDEWYYQKNIIKQKLISYLIKPEELDVNKIDIQVLDSNKCIDFIEDNSLIGFNEYHLYLSLYYDNQLTAILCINRKNNNTYDIMDFCEIKNINSFDLLLNYFILIAKPSIINVKLDRRFIDFIKYQNNNFKITSVSKPLCWKIEHGHRSNIIENAINSSIFDCGSLLMEWKDQNNVK